MQKQRRIRGIAPCGRGEEERKQDYRRCYLSEFSLYDGECFVTFNIVEVNTEKRQIIVGVSKQGRVSLCTFDLNLDKDGQLYFEYGVMLDKVCLDDFEQVEED